MATLRPDFSTCSFLQRFSFFLPIPQREKAETSIQHGCQHQKKILKLLLNIFFNPFSRLRGPDWGFFLNWDYRGKRGKKEHFCLSLALFGGNQFSQDENACNPQQPKQNKSHEASPEQVLRLFIPSMCKQHWFSAKMGFGGGWRTAFSVPSARCVGMEVEKMPGKGCLQLLILFISIPWLSSAYLYSCEDVLSNVLYVYIYICACALLYLYSSQEDSFSDGRCFLEVFGGNLGLWADRGVLAMSILLKKQNISGGAWC